MKFYVYHYYDPESGVPFYVGKGKGRRAYEHLARCERSNDSSYNTFFYKKLRKMFSRRINPDVKIIRDQLTEDEAFDLEISEIKRIGRRNLGKGPLTNLSDGGDGSSGRIVSEESKQRMSESHLGKVPTEESKQKMREARLGKTHTEETKQKISKFHSGKKLSKEHCQKLLKANLGRKVSQETRQKMSETHRICPVENFDIDGNTIDHFDSIESVTKKGYTKCCVSNCLAGRQKTHRNLYWRYSHA